MRTTTEDECVAVFCAYLFKRRGQEVEIGESRGPVGVGKEQFRAPREEHTL
jgi:hypothetical protein